MSSILTGVSGMQATQRAVDVIANNIANLNTVAFKAGRVTFEETLVQTLSGGSLNGTNPLQIGTGTAVSSIDTIMTPGNKQPTGRTLDLAIDGSGFFVVQNGIDRSFTRDGVFQLDGQNNLVMASNGMRVQGWTKNIATGGWEANSDPQVDPPGTLRIPLGTSYAVPTSKATFSGNLDAATLSTDTQPPATTFTFYDSLGTAHTLSMQFAKTATSNEWTCTVTGSTGVNISSPATSVPITFNENGQTSTVVPVSITLANGASPQNINLDLTMVSQLTKVNENDTSVVQATTQDGLPMGTLQSFSIDADGFITGSYSNGASRVLGQLAVARFTNPAGLSRSGSNLYTASPNSGDPVVQPPTSGGGTICSGYLESSNVDLATELSNLIVTQRGFQANSKSITTSDEMMQDILQLKR